MNENATPDPKINIEEITPGVFIIEFAEIEKDTARNVMQAEYFEKHVTQAFQKYPDKKIHFLVDTTPVKESRLMSKEARQIYLRLYADSHVGKVAFIGLGVWLRQMIRVFTQVAGRWDTSRVFKSKEEALTWLKH